MRVPDDEIGVGAGQDGALFRIDVEDAGNIGGGDGDEFVHRQPAGGNAARPQHRHAVLQPAGAVGNLGEIADTHAFLLGGEGAMVGRHDL